MENSATYRMQRGSSFWFFLPQNSHLPRSSAAKVERGGFIQISILIMIPLLASTFLGTLAISWFIQKKQKIQLLCEKSALSAQSTLASGANSLITLNPGAELLVMEKKTLQVAIHMAQTPAEKAALTLQLLIVLRNISALRAEQIQLIAATESRARIEMLNLKRNMLSEARHIQRLWQSQTLSPSVKITPPKIKLVPRFIDVMIPVYEAPLGYEKIQSLHVAFAMRGASLFPQWLKFLWAQTFFWQENCSSRPEKGGQGWESRLGMGK